MSKQEEPKQGNNYIFYLFIGLIGLSVVGALIYLLAAFIFG